MNILGERLKMLRESRNLTQTEVASALGVSLATYSRYESGDREPSLDNFLALCRYFDESPSSLLPIVSDATVVEIKLKDPNHKLTAFELEAITKYAQYIIENRT